MSSIVVTSFLLAASFPLLQASGVTPLGAAIAPHGKIATGAAVSASSATAKPKAAVQLARRNKPIEAKSDADKSESSKESTQAKAHADVKDKDKEVQIDIYYESLCPYCQKILAEELPELWSDTDFRQRINVNFWPYGNAATIAIADVSEGYRFWHEELENKDIKYVFPCQHGADECFGNLVHNCAIDLLKVAEKYIPFITCMEAAAARMSTEMGSYECAQNNSLDATELKGCVRGARGNELMYAAGEKTNGLTGKAGPREYVPWIVINGEHIENAELDGEPDETGHLAVAVCNRFKSPNPPGCAAAYAKMKELKKKQQQAENSFLFRAVANMVLRSSAQSFAPGILTVVLVAIAALRKGE